MSGFSQNIYSPDRTTQAIALLGGATANSYNSLSLLNASVNPNSQLNSEDAYSRQSGAEAFQSSSESTGSTLDRAVFDSGSATPVLDVPQHLILDELVAFDSLPGLATKHDLTSLFDDGTLDSSDLQGVQGFGSNAEPELASLAELPEIGNQGFSLLDFIEQAVAQAQTPQDPLANGLDPSVEPLLGATFYADLILQPIGSLSSPRFEPVLSVSADELTTYLG